MFNFKRFLLDTYDPDRKSEKRKSRKFSLQPSSFKRKGDVSPQWQKRRSTLAAVVDEPSPTENDQPIQRRKKGFCADAATGRIALTLSYAYYLFGYFCTPKRSRVFVFEIESVCPRTSIMCHVGYGIC